MIHLQDVHIAEKGFYLGPINYAGISIKNKTGCLIALTGQNGTGKSTLLKTIALDKPLTKGRVRFSKHTTKAYLPSSPKVFSKKNVSYLLSLNAKDQKTGEIAEKFNITHLLDRPFNVLSDGEQKIVLIAMQMQREASYFFFDEPLAHLDMQKKEFVLSIFKEHAEKNNACFLISIHDRYLLDAYFDDQVNLDDVLKN